MVQPSPGSLICSALLQTLVLMRLAHVKQRNRTSVVDGCGLAHQLLVIHDSVHSMLKTGLQYASVPHVLHLCFCETGVHNREVSFIQMSIIRRSLATNLNKSIILEHSHTEYRMVLANNPMYQAPQPKIFTESRS